MYCIKARTCFHMIVISLNFFYFCFLFVFIVIFCHLKDNTIIMIKCLWRHYIFFMNIENPRGSRRGVGDKPMSCKPGVAGSIPDFR